MSGGLKKAELFGEAGYGTACPANPASSIPFFCGMSFIFLDSSRAGKCSEACIRAGKILYFGEILS